jgi:hypothetical protein
MLRLLPFVFVLSLAPQLGGCAGMEASSAGAADGDRRGDVNGWVFRLLSEDEDGEWNVRVRGDTMWVGRVRGRKEREIGNFRLTEKQSGKLWNLIDAINIPERKSQDLDGEPSLFVRLRQREEGNWSTYISRDEIDEDEDVNKLVTYIERLIRKHTSKDIIL